MDLIDLIEKRRFLGREFLVWLWFESELCEGRFDVRGFGPCEIGLESRITLAQDKEQSRLVGAIPSAAPEAREALRQGKLPTVARVRVSRGELSYVFLFTADTLALSAMKIPAVMKEESDDQFYERMYLVEDLEALMASLYGDFLALRLSTVWPEAVVPAIRAWVRGEPTIDATAYGLLRRRVAPLAAVERPKTTPPPAVGAFGQDEEETGNGNETGAGNETEAEAGNEAGAGAGNEAEAGNEAGAGNENENESVSRRVA